MNKEETLKLLYRFTDQNRSALKEPFPYDTKHGKFIVGTDAHIVVFVPETEENRIEAPDTKFPNIDAILPEFNENIEIDFKHLLKLYSDVPIIDYEEKEECPSCDGMGNFTHYKNMYDCKECDEKGVVRTGHIIKIKNPNTLFKFNDFELRIKHIKSIIEIQATTKVESPLVIVSKSNSVVWFKLSDIIIGIAKYRDMEDDDDIEVIKVI